VEFYMMTMVRYLRLEEGFPSRGGEEGKQREWQGEEWKRWRRMLWHLKAGRKV